MAASSRSARQSVSLPLHLARRVKVIAKSRRVSASRVIADLIENGLESQDREKARFLELAERLTTSRHPEEQSKLREELARMTFGE